MGLTYRLLVRTLVTRARIVALSAIGGTGLFFGAVIRFADQPPHERLDITNSVLIGTFGMNLVIPVTALVFASAALGDPVEDRTLVYLWLAPTARWRIVVAAWLASLTVAVPVGAGSVVLACALAGGDAQLVAATAAGAVLATAGYTSLFVLLGMLVRRALAWGLAYVLVWELAVSRIAKGAARLSVSVYSRSVLADLGNVSPPRNFAATSTSLIVLAIVVAAAIALSTRLLRRLDVA
jgi:ABC-2 type transport system permease protein